MLNPQLALAFNGQCATAMRFYERCLGGTLAVMMTWHESPMASQAPPGMEDKVFHATLKIGDTAIMGSDVAPDRYQPPAAFSIVLNGDDPDAAERIFHELADGGRIDIPLQETFWASRFGAVTDRFGVSWSINCEKAAEAARNA